MEFDDAGSISKDNARENQSLGLECGDNAESIQAREEAKKAETGSQANTGGPAAVHGFEAPVAAGPEFGLRETRRPFPRTKHGN
jgi:hypothetical protein